MRQLWLVIILLSASLPAFAQEDKPQKVFLNGYIKSLQGLFFTDAFTGKNELLLDNLIHNRLNLRWYINDQLTFRSDLRSRIFYGDLVKLTPAYGDLIDDVNNDYFDLSKVVFNHSSVVGHTMIDRLYLEWIPGNWEIRLGRQRVNWGISTVWNPNDVFNAFAFTDFDYEERPGSDALRIRRFLGFASSIEIAIKAFDDIDEAVIAGLYKINQWNYDFQVLAGFVQNDIALGGGWAGNIKNAGFKGEFTYFIPLVDENVESFAVTLGVDYSLRSGVYFNIGYLFNDRGTSNRPISTLFDFDLSAKNLYPYRHALFFQVSYPFNPLINGGVAIIYSPVEVHALFVNPTIGVSIAQNWDLDLVGQIVFDREDNSFVSPIQAGFVRFKYSF